MFPTQDTLLPKLADSEQTQEEGGNGKWGWGEGGVSFFSPLDVEGFKSDMMWGGSLMSGGIECFDGPVKVKGRIRYVKSMLE